MDLSPARYRYQRITDEGTVRLILLQPSKVREDGIQCSLVQATLDELDNDIVEHYVALSYVWGDPNNTRSISVDGSQLEITSSLDVALRHIRDPTRVLRVWADGICINQQDAQDRNLQVLQMGPIYSRARHTIIFIGESTPERDAFMCFLRSQSFTSKSLHHPPDHCLSTWFPPSTTSAEEDHHILHAPWFTRVWVLQELVLSSDPWLQCGSHRVRWPVFSSVVLSAAPSTSPQTAARIAILRHMNEARANFYRMQDRLHLTPPGHLLLELLLGRKGFGVSDPRDMIYAHLGLTDSATRAAIPVDYNKSVAQVYEEVARQYIEWKGNLSVLIYAEEVELEKRREGLPSWVPDWTIPQITSTDKRSPTNPQHEVTSGREDIISTAVPSILGVVGWSHGVIKTMIPASSLLELPSDLDAIFTLLRQETPTTFLLYLLPILLEFNTHIWFSFPPQYREILFAAGTDIDHHSQATLPPILSNLVAMSQAKLENEIPEPLMLWRIVRNIQELSTSSEGVVLLDDGQLAQAPPSTRVGDIIAHFHGEGKGASHFILRPVQIAEDPNMKKTLLEDINTRGEAKPAIKQIQHCQFVKRGGRLLHQGYKAALLKGTEPVVFALH